MAWVKGSGQWAEWPVSWELKWSMKLYKQWPLGIPLLWPVRFQRLEKWHFPHDNGYPALGNVMNFLYANKIQLQATYGLKYWTQYLIGLGLPNLRLSASCKLTHLAMDYVSIWSISPWNLNYYFPHNEVHPFRCGKPEGPECNMPIYLVPWVLPF